MRKSTPALLKSFFILLLSGCLGIAPVGCKRLADKPAPFKRAVYLSTGAIGLEYGLDALEVLERANHITTPQGTAIRKVIGGLAKAYIEVDDLLFRGDLVNASAKALAIAASLKKLQDENAFQITNDESRGWFVLIIDLARLAITALANQAATGTPKVVITSRHMMKLHQAQDLKTRAMGVPTFILELAGLVVEAQTEINNLIYLNTVDEVRKVGRDIAQGLIAKLGSMAQWIRDHTDVTYILPIESGKIGQILVVDRLTKELKWIYPTSLQAPLPQPKPPGADFSRPSVINLLPSPERDR